MIGRYDLGGYPAPALRAAGLVRQGLADHGKVRAVRPDFLDNAVGSCQPLSRPGICRGPLRGPAFLAHLSSGELVAGPDVHICHRIRWPQPVT
jgi:hypothetical protein